MKTSFMAFMFLLVSASVSQAADICGKIETINVREYNLVLKTGEQIKFARSADTIATLTTTMAGDLTVCFKPDGTLATISK